MVFVRKYLSPMMALVCVMASVSASSRATAQSGSGSLIVNIDSPNFRKLIAAVPKWTVQAGSPSDVRQSATTGPAELSRLLEFSGMFSVMVPQGYEDLVDGSGRKSKKGPVAPKGLEGIDLLEWKSIGVESLTMGEVERQDGALEISLRTVDINKGELLIGKKFSRVAAADVPRVMRRYADLLLQAYTGKSGIFSSRIAFIGRRAKGADKQVYTCDFDGGNLVQVTRNRGPHLSVQWSPDGKSLVYTSFESGDPDIYIHDLATDRKRKLVGDRGLQSGASFAPSGKLIAFSSSASSDSGDVDIFTVTPDGRNKRHLIRGASLDVDPTFSPDGKYIAFVSGRFGNPHLFRGTLKWNGDLDVSVTDDIRLTYAGWYNVSPTWSPQMDKLVFAGYDRQTDRWDLFIMNIDGTALERLTIHTGDNERPSWAPNGQLIVFESSRVGSSDVKGTPQLWIMNRDGSGQRPLVTGLWEARTPVWSNNRE